MYTFCNFLPLLDNIKDEVLVVDDNIVSNKLKEKVFLIYYSTM